MYQPTAPDPWRRCIALRRTAMSFNASSQVTGSKPLGLRRNGVVTRSGSLTTSVNAMPFWQAKPDDSGWSLSGRSATKRPSSTVAIMPQSGSQIRQNVGLCAITAMTPSSAPAASNWACRVRARAERSCCGTPRGCHRRCRPAARSGKCTRRHRRRRHRRCRLAATDAAPRMSIRSGEMSRIVCARATRPKMLGAESAASIRATLRPSRYATDPSSIGQRPFGSFCETTAAALSTASAMNPA